MERDYVFLESTTSLCNNCLKPIEAKIIIKDKKIWIKKYCKKHGEQIELLEENAEYHLNKRKCDKKSTYTKPQTKIKNGCPYDCGLCPDHDQHTCNALIEITEECDLGCPVCYANSGKKKRLDLKTIEKMLDFFKEVENNEPEILQISGGEPTTHPDILKIIEIAKSKNIRYIMLNTNGLRIANDEEFVKELAKFRGRFEIYLQFDGFSKKTYKSLRGKDIYKTKLKAIKNLQKYKIPITIVATIQKGINEKEIGKIFKFGLKQPCIRGINFQPLAYFGRIKECPKDRMTLSGIIKRLEKQAKLKPGDIVPLPCNVERVAISYFYRTKKGFYPLTRKFNIESYLPAIDNTFAFDADKIIKDKKRLLMTKGFLCDCALGLLKDIKEIIPPYYSELSNEEKMDWWNNNSFRISISSFVDKFNFDSKSMKKECVHILTPDLKRIPFSAHNMIHRK